MVVGLCGGSVPARVLRPGPVPVYRFPDRGNQEDVFQGKLGEGAAEEVDPAVGVEPLVDDDMVPAAVPAQPAVAVQLPVADLDRHPLRQVFEFLQKGRTVHGAHEGKTIRSSPPVLKSPGSRGSDSDSHVAVTGRFNEL